MGAQCPARYAAAAGPRGGGGLRPLHDPGGAHGGVPVGLAILPPAAYEGLPDLDPFAGRDAAAQAFHGILEAGVPARFAAFAVADEAELLERGATTCVATVIGGRLLHRRR